MSKVLYNMNKKDILIVCALEMETQGQLDDYNVIYTGVGKVNAAYKLTRHLVTFGCPKRVINFGTAGSRALPIGKLVECTKFVQRDMDKTALGFEKAETAFETDVPRIIEFGDGLICGTGDNFVQDIMKEMPMINVFDMEAYALAKICKLHDIKFKCFKYISDYANDESSNDWIENCHKGAVEFLSLYPECK